MTMTTELREATERVTALRDKVRGIFAEAKGSDGKESLSNIKSIENPADAIKQLNDELSDAVKNRETLQAALNAKKTADELDDVDPNNRPPREDAEDSEEEDKRTWGEQFTDSKAYKEYVPGMPSAEFKLAKGIKTLLQTSAGFDPEVTRIPDVVPIIKRPVQLLDLIRQVPTTQDGVQYMEQTTRTWPSGTGMYIAEGGVYNDATMEWTERNVPVVKLGVNIPITEEQLADVPGLQAIVSSDLPAMLAEYIDDQLINGAGATGQLSGIRNVTGVQTHEKGGDEAKFSAILEGIADVEVGGRSSTDRILMHSRDWYGMLQEQSHDGMYILGLPDSQASMRLWGLPVTKVDSLPRGTAIVGDFGTHAMIRDRQDVRTRIAPRWHVDQRAIDPTESSATAYPAAATYTRPTGQVNIFSDIRLAFYLRRPQAFSIVSGI